MKFKNKTTGETKEWDYIEINSNLVSAQDRIRFYWTNIQDIPNIQDKNILLKDVIEEKVEEKYYYKQSFDYLGEDKKIEATLHINGHDILKRVYNKNFKVGTLTCCRGGNLQKKVFQNGTCRKLIPLEYERLQTVPENYTNMVCDGHRYNMLGNGWTIDVIKHIFESI